MGLRNRVKQAASGVGETIDEVRTRGILGGVIAQLGKFSKRNADAVKTVGDDVGMLRR